VATPAAAVAVSLALLPTNLSQTHCMQNVCNRNDLFTLSFGSALCRAAAAASPAGPAPAIAMSTCIGVVLRHATCQVDNRL
jgi:hypothetical protein